MRYRDLDEVRAPEDLPDFGVKAGDRGVVVAELRDPRTNPPSEAVEVEYSRPDGVPRAYVIYSPDPSKVYSQRTDY